MHNGFAYINGKIVIVDEKTQQTVDYYENVDKDLYLDNVIESLETKKVELNTLIKMHRPYDIKEKLVNFSLPVFLLLLSPILAVSITAMVNPEILSTALVSGTAMGVLMGGFFSPISITAHRESKRRVKRQNADLAQLAGIEKELEKCRSKKESINRNVSKDKNNQGLSNDYYRIDNDKIKEELRELYNFCRMIGYDKDKFEELYNEGKLRLDLSEYFTDEQVDAAEDMFKEKIFVKKMN